MIAGQPPPDALGARNFGLMSRFRVLQTILRQRSLQATCPMFGLGDLDEILRPASTRFTSGNASQADAVATACRLRGARQHLQAPPTSDVRPGLHFTQPPDNRGHGQQTVNS